MITRARTLSRCSIQDRVEYSRAQRNLVLERGFVPLMDRKLAEGNAWIVGYLYKIGIQDVVASGRAEWVDLWHRAYHWLTESEVDIASIGMSCAKSRQKTGVI